MELLHSIFLMTCKVEKCCNQKSPSGMFAKLHTVAASNNRVHVPRSLSAYASRYIQLFTS